MLGRIVSSVSSALDLNIATLSGCIDVVVVPQADGTLRSTPFHVRFGKTKLLRSREKEVTIFVNGEPTDLRMKLGAAGEAFFEELDDDDDDGDTRDPDIENEEMCLLNVDPSAHYQRRHSHTEPPRFEEKVFGPLPLHETDGVHRAHGSADSLPSVMRPNPHNPTPRTAIDRCIPEIFQETLGRAIDYENEMIHQDYEKANNNTLPTPTLSLDISATKRAPARERFSRNDADHRSALSSQANPTERPSRDSSVDNTGNERISAPLISSTTVDDREPQTVNSSSASQPVDARALSLPKPVIMSNTSDTSCVEFSLSGDLLSGNYRETDRNNDCFNANVVSWTTLNTHPSLWYHPSLVCRFDRQPPFYPGRVALPLLASWVAFNKPLSLNAVETLMETKIETKSVRDKTLMDWVLGGGRTSQPSGANDSNLPRPVESAEAAVRASTTSPRSTDISCFTCAIEPARTKRSLRPSPEKLASLNLKPGQNEITFTVTSSLQGTKTVSGFIYLWSPYAKIIVSDVDGTITRSDVLGQLMPIVGRDWSHSGVADLFTKCRESNYEILYLTARAIGQADATRDYLFGLRQGDAACLPDGPLIMSPDRLFPSFKREVIDRKPYVFKIAALRDIRQLFPRNYNPFYAGFGNRDTDHRAYVHIGIPESRVFIIDPKGTLHHINATYAKTYKCMSAISDHMFPVLPGYTTYGHESVPIEEQFNDFQYWKPNYDFLGPEDDDAHPVDPIITDSSIALFESSVSLLSDQDDYEDDSDNSDGTDLTIERDIPNNTETTNTHQQDNPDIEKALENEPGQEGDPHTLIQKELSYTGQENASARAPPLPIPEDHTKPLSPNSSVSIAGFVSF